MRLGRVSPPRGLRFPGEIRIPEAEPGELAKADRDSRAIEFAREFESGPRTFWTDGSALPGGVGAGAVVGFVEGYEEADQRTNRIIREREGILGCGQRDR